MGERNLRPVTEDHRAPVIRPFTDLGNAERLVARHGDDMRFCHDWNQWLVWDGTRWTRDATRAVKRLAINTVRGIHDEKALTDDSDVRQAITKHAKRSESDASIEAMLRVAAALDQVPVTPDQLDADPWLLTTPGGTVDLRTGQLHTHRREDLITKRTIGTVRGDIGSLTAVAPPTWSHFLATTFPGDDDLRRWVQLAAGYSLSGSTREQCMFLLYGVGANGKSTFLEAVQHTLGDYAQSTPTETLMANERSGGIPNDVARLKGARFVSAAESETSSRISEGLVKRLTGGDKMVARFMRAEFFEFTPECKIWLAVNHRPSIQGTDEGIWRRMRLVPFTATIPPDQRDRDLPTRLQAEADGILAWAIEGCLAWQRQAGGLGIARSVAAATDAYRMEMDVLGRWMDDCCTLGPGHLSSARGLYASYKRWADDEGHKAYSATRFGRELGDRGLEKKLHGPDRTTHYVGISVRNLPSAPSGVPL
jgi:putative DNA primase/helicase